VAKEENYSELITFRGGIDGGQMILVEMKINNMTSGGMGGFQEIIIMMGETCCMKERRYLWRKFCRDI
jgi:hypothetical protein